ncbi:dolichyl-phosphate-mannose--protein mannosyltransferase [Arthrobacter antioxidans]|uniref:dolichyl-phosphate-mannose--protein mannosyltransferase n=1 Tax=Arthrobacter antioxidans TaxID=2895818 RepID=UPI001FFFDA00|nr:phospholipid carrier-dependent glycosyltransferase [Arthrobacter antioxidans]
MSPTAVRPRRDSPQQAGSWVLAPSLAFTRDALLARLLGAASPGGALRWVLPLAVALLGGILRFVRLGDPGSLVFDETYYVKDAYSLLQSGYEREWPEDANDSFNAGTPDVLLATADYVVHPPVGKWMIAVGMLLFGADNAFGWRFSAAVVGTLSVLLLAVVAQRMFGSALLGAAAGLLLAVDGHHLVQSRTSLLDIFLSFWLLAAFAALLVDRDDGRRRLADRLAASALGGGPTRAQLAYGPFLGFRPWRLAAGVCLGLALGTKWSALPFIAAFGLMTVAWDMSARRIAGVHHWLAGAAVKDGLLAFACLVPVAALTYLGTWTGWFLSSDAYDRTWAGQNPSEQWGWLPDGLRSLAEYHRSAYTFHQGLGSDHPYEASAWSWLVVGRPTSYFYEKPAGCGADACSQAVTVLGNPLIWWSAALSLVVLLFFWLGRRDWRAAAVLTGVAAGYLPWFLYPERTTFYFYAVAFEPFLVLSLVYCLGLVLGGPAADGARRRTGIVLVGLFLAAAVALSAYFLPIWTAEVIPYDQWRDRMWLPSWI